VLIKVLGVPLAAAAAAAGGARASAAAKSPQSAVQYQDKPKGSAKCSGCQFFLPGASATAKGHCQVVDGDISPTGWCVVYSARS
jgi:hypothetical protein